MSMPDQDYVQWLVDQSMLRNAKLSARKYAGQSRQWQRPYGEAKARAATAIASVWFNAYPPSIVTEKGASVLKTLGDAKLWDALASLGIQAIHTGPTKRAGGIVGREFTPSIDGNFDRIGLDIDAKFGTTEQYVAMSRMASAHNAIVIDDVVPSHSGKGADFRLAEMAYEDYPGIYHMVEIREADWNLLPLLQDGQEVVNLSPPAVDALAKKGYIVGQLQRVIFFEPGVKETDWSATGPIVGVDGHTRRWVYLHYFKAGQPSLNWLDPTFAAQQMIIGDALHAIDSLGAVGLRLDANGFLGVEVRTGGLAWSEGHPLSLVGNSLLAGAIRKAGGFSFQELNLTVDDIAAMSQGGADLSYDFITRPAYHHAILTGDTEFLRLMLRTMHEFKIDPASLIHGLQNHDELTLELVHFWTLHADEIYTFQGKTWQGRTLRTHLRETMYSKLSGEHAPYNQKFVTNGVACTTASVIAAALAIRNLDEISEEQIAQIQKIHLLLAMYNAFQPGVFALSGWDMIGALPLPASEVEDMMQDGDTRWIQRGAYDLMDVNADARVSSEGMPKCRSLYGSLAEQLKRPDSFISQLKHLLSVRQSYGIAGSHQTAVPDVKAAGLLIMIHELPDGRGTQITALNFGADEIDEVLAMPEIPRGPIVDMLHGVPAGDVSEEGEIQIQLAPYEGKSLRIVTHYHAPT
ncbi:maltose alpha-D-glucosyltransferase [Lichenibacterium ramalinae]|uniref:Maltose alpha-D-glucosyltransferase n=1 Tax=Lichenibacterium ramalinae TaxID=2316527 RepID=A0A4Q2R5Q3_9HYPH|nr:maltose alpha-D-glucosyltransferase [Lichenibacterium ramalinae]RYB01865.1 maltose alpha-D-glucosyltransferase [Lichenibacterium ramalinae]